MYLTAPHRSLPEPCPTARHLPGLRFGLIRPAVSPARLISLDISFDERRADKTHALRHNHNRTHPPHTHTHTHTHTHPTHTHTHTYIHSHTHTPTTHTQKHTTTQHHRTSHHTAIG